METDLRVGDCLELLGSLREGSVDVVVTSPPYNLGIPYRSYKDSLDRTAYIAWMQRWARVILRVLRQDGSLFLNLGEASRDPLLPHETLIAICQSGWVLQNTIHWIKSISLDQPDGSVMSRGHFKPVNSRRYVNRSQEYLFHLTRTGHVPLDRLAVGVPYEHKSNIARWGHTGGHDLRCRGNVWFIPYRTIQCRDAERPHPATFPVQLAEWAIRLHGKKAAVVADPFLGLGSSGEAALRAGAKRFHGFDVDEAYVRHSRGRLEALGAHSSPSGANPAFR